MRAGLRSNVAFGGQLREGLPDPALARLRLLGLFDGFDVLLAMRVAQLVPSGVRGLVGAQRTFEVERRSDDAWGVVALHDDADGVAATDAGPGAHLTVYHHVVMAV